MYMMSMNIIEMAKTTRGSTAVMTAEVQKPNKDAAASGAAERRRNMGQQC